MALKNTVKHMKELLCGISKDLEKAERGNKAASQRVRTKSIKLEKTAKLYRKESVKEARSKKGTKKKTTAKKGAKKTTKKRAAAPKRKVTKRRAPAKKSTRRRARR